MSSYKRAPPQDKPVPNSLTSLTARDSSLSAAASEDGEASQWNPVSKWQEEVEVPGLTLYDIHREPRRVSSNTPSRVRVQLKVCGVFIWHHHSYLTTCVRLCLMHSIFVFTAP